MAFPSPTNYHTDSDADDEYERSVLTSPMPPTDDETSSVGDSDTASHDNTPTTFEGPDFDRLGPRTLITEWTTDECAAFLGTLSLPQYGRTFLENEIVGEALIALRHEELKEMGVASVGHRLTILKGVYDMKMRQDIPIDSDHYVPLSAEEGTRNKQATQDDISRIIQSLQIRDHRILEAEAELRRMQEEYKKLREELLPVFKMSKERNDSLPSPVFAQNNASQPGLSRKPSKNKNNLHLGSGPIKSASPTWPPTSIPEGRQMPSNGLDPSAAAQAASADLATAMNSMGVNLSAGSPNIPSPGASPGVHHQRIVNEGRGYGSASTASSVYVPHSAREDHHLSGTTIASEYGRDSHRPGTATTVGGGGGGRAGGRSVAPSVREVPSGGDDSGSSAPAVEVFKSFRVSMDDPCYKVLPAALKKYNIQADWKQYALYIVYGDQERCLGLEEKPLILFKQLDKEGRKPMFMLRRHVTPIEGHTGPSTVGNTMGAGIGAENPARGAIQLPGGVL